MHNRITKFLNEGDSMEIHSTEELKKVMEESKGYLVSLTLLNDGKLEHHLLSKDFPYLDMLKSHRKQKDLIIKQLEEEIEQTPEF
jgi:hypothetical protein